MNRTTYRQQLAALSPEELDVIVEALEAYRANLAKQVKHADDRAIARGARPRPSIIGGYVGQHESTQEKREAVQTAQTALYAVRRAATEAWNAYGYSIVKGVA